MGDNVSKTADVEGGDIKLFSPEERGLYKQMYVKCCDKLSAKMRRSLFHDVVIGDLFPPPVAEFLYYAFGGASDGISLENLLRGIGTLSRSTSESWREDRIKILFRTLVPYGQTPVYANKTKLFNLLSTLESQEKAELVRKFVDKYLYIDYDLFHSWVSQNWDLFSFTHWLLGNPAVSGFEILHTNNGFYTVPTLYGTLARITHLDEREIELLDKHFAVLCGSNKQSMDYSTFRSLVCPPMADEITRGFFNAFDSNRDERIDFKEYVYGLSACCRGPRPDRRKFLFRVFDFDQDGLLSKAEVFCLVDSCVRMQCQFWEFFKFGSSSSVDGSSLYRNNADDHTFNSPDLVEQVMTCFDPNQDMYVELDDFLLWAEQTNVLGVFCALLEQICHVVFGLKPLNPEQEGILIKSFIKREKSLLSIGSLWYVIPQNWWHRWIEHTTCDTFFSSSSTAANHFITTAATNTSNKAASLHNTHMMPNGSSSCSSGWNNYHEYHNLKTANSHVSHSSYAVPSASSSASSSPTRSRKLPKINGASWRGRQQSYTVTPLPFDETSNQKPLGPIDTSKLISKDKPKVAQLQSIQLLKSDSEGKYECIPIAVWRSLVTWYGSTGPPIRRTAIRDPSRSKGVKIETHPLVLNLYKHTQKAPTLQNFISQHVPETLYFALNTTPVPNIIYNTTNGGIGMGTTSTSWSTPTPSTGGGTSSASSVSSTQQQMLQLKRNLINTVVVSQDTTISDLRGLLLSKFNAKNEDMRLWHYKSEDCLILLSDEATTLYEADVSSGDNLLMEKRQLNSGLWPESILQKVRSCDSILMEQEKDGRKRQRGDELSESAYNKENTCGTTTSASGGSSNHRRVDSNDSSTSSSSNTTAATQMESRAGQAGLHNIGNTCFMNSALQCLSHTYALTSYFLKEKHFYEINMKSLDGSNGQVALSYGHLIEQLWSENGCNVVRPAVIRDCIVKYRTQFNNSNQHDAQEMLEAVLDLLHEDLNRVTHRKSYQMLAEADGRSDFDVAEEQWTAHIKNNNSIVSDLFTGQMHCKMTCCTCGRSTSKFDVFNVLSLSIPSDAYTIVYILLQRLDAKPPTRYGLRVLKNSTYGEVKDQFCSSVIGLDCGVKKWQIIFVDTLSFNHSNTNSSNSFYSYNNSGASNSSGSKNGQPPPMTAGMPIVPGALIDDNCKLKSNTAVNSAILITAFEVSLSGESSEEDYLMMNNEQHVKMMNNCNSSECTEDVDCISGGTGGSNTGLAATGGSLQIDDSQDVETDDIIVNSNSTTTPLLATPSHSNDSLSKTLLQPQSSRLSKGGVDMEGKSDKVGEDNLSDGLSNVSNYGALSSDVCAVNCPTSTVTSPTVCIDSVDDVDGSGSGSGDTNKSITPRDKHYSQQCPPSLSFNSYNSLSVSPVPTSAAAAVVDLELTPSSSGYASDNWRSPMNTDSVRAAMTPFVFAVHVKQSPNAVYFLRKNQSRTCLFGRPLLIPISPGCTNSDVYSIVERQISRFVTTSPSDQNSNHAKDCDEMLCGRGRYPFLLRKMAIVHNQSSSSFNNVNRCSSAASAASSYTPILNSHSLRCWSCPWYDTCRGCIVELTQDAFEMPPTSPTISNSTSNALPAKSANRQQNNATSNPPSYASSASTGALKQQPPIVYVLAIEWNTTILHLRFDFAAENEIVVDSSVEHVDIQHKQPLSLDDCLGLLTKEQVINDFSPCPKCKSTKISLANYIWRSPPNLIIHLKRYEQPMSGGGVSCSRWIKCHKRVSFPIDNLNMMPYVSPGAHQLNMQFARITAGLEPSEISRFVADCSSSHDSSSLPTGTTNKCSCNGNNSSNKSDEIANAQNSNDDEFSSCNGSSSKTSVCKDDYFNYRLFSISCHAGDLTNGHYVSMCRNPLTQKWYCFNDNNCREMSVSSIPLDSTYLLFYELTKLDTSHFLPLVDNKQPVITPSDFKSNPSNFISCAALDSRKNCVVM